MKRGIALQSMLEEVFDAVLRSPELEAGLAEVISTLAHVERCVTRGGGEEVLLHAVVKALRRLQDGGGERGARRRQPRRRVHRAHFLVPRRVKHPPTMMGGRGTSGTPSRPY